MALDPRIALAGQVTDVAGAIQSGQKITGNSMSIALQRQNQQVNAMGIAQKQAQYTNNLFTSLRDKPLDERAAIMAQNMGVLEQYGIPPSELMGNLDDAGIDRVLAATQPFMSRGAPGEQFTLSPGSVRYDEFGRVVAQNEEAQGQDGGSGGAPKYKEISTNPLTGVTTGFNEDSGKVEVIPAGEAAQAALTAQAQRNTTEAEDKSASERTSQLFGQSKDLRNEYESVTKEDKATIESFGAIEAVLNADDEVISSFKDAYEANAPDNDAKEKILNDSRAISDIALIFAFFKTVDPTSTVREGEFATVEQAGSVGTRFQNLYNRLLSGERMGDAQRNQVIRIAQNKRNSAATKLNSTQDKYTTLASEFNINPGTVILGEKYSSNVDLTSKFSSDTAQQEPVQIDPAAQQGMDELISQSLGN